MYPFLQMEHSYGRWLVLVALLVRIGIAGWGWARGQAWGVLDARASLAAIVLADLQFAVGLILWLFFSPLTAAARQNIGAAMKDATLRQALVEHPTMMILALAALHIGNSRVKKAATDLRKHQIAAITVGLALVFMLVGIPWR